MAVYVVDSNFFIQAHRDTYPLDVALGFWNKVKELAISGTIVSIDKVKEEIYRNDDALKEWCKANLPDNFFNDSSTVLAEYQQVVAWAVSKSAHYSANALSEFLDADEADAFLVAYALNDSQTRKIITQEISNPLQKSKIKIPEPCQEFGVRYLKTIDAFREMGVTF